MLTELARLANRSMPCFSNLVRDLAPFSSCLTKKLERKNNKCFVNSVIFLAGA